MLYTVCLRLFYNGFLSGSLLIASSLVSPSFFIWYIKVFWIFFCVPKFGLVLLTYEAHWDHLWVTEWFRPACWGTPESPSLPFYSILLNGTPGLDLTGFKGVVVVLNTSASPPACEKGFETEKNCDKYWPTKNEDRFLWEVKTVPWPSKSTSPWTQSESVVQLALATWKYWSKMRQMLNVYVLNMLLLHCLFLHTKESFCWPLTSAQVPCIWSYVTSRLNIVLMTSPPCEGNATKRQLVCCHSINGEIVSWLSICFELASEGRAYSTVSKIWSPWTAEPFITV